VSLTFILDYRNREFKALRGLLSKSFPLPKFRSSALIKAEPKTANYQLIGTAFDYLLRFHLERKYKDRVESSKWVSEGALKYFEQGQDGIVRSYYNPAELNDNDFEKWFKEKQEKNRIQNIEVPKTFSACRNIYKQFIALKRTDKNNLSESCLFLARLDSVVRIGQLAKEYVSFGPENKLDVDDLNELVESCDLKLFKPRNKIILNPTFGSALIKADADIIVDNTLIDVKVTKVLSLTRQNFNQLLGYYLLYLNGGIQHHANTKIEKLGIYFARHNVLWTAKVDDLGSHQLFEAAEGLLKETISRKRLPRRSKI